MMEAGLKFLDIPSLDGNTFKKVIMDCIRDIIINFFEFFVRYGVTSTSYSLYDCPDGSYDVPNVIIYGACVQMGWC